MGGVGRSWWQHWAALCGCPALGSHLLCKHKSCCVCVSDGLSCPGQLSVLQAELESQCEARCERALASAKEQHARQCQELCEQRDSLQHQLAQLEDKVKGCSLLNWALNTRLLTPNWSLAF